MYSDKKQISDCLEIHEESQRLKGIEKRKGLKSGMRKLLEEDSIISSFSVVMASKVYTYGKA